MGLWTDRCRPVIERVLSELPVGATEAQVKKALSDAYPFGQRINYPYTAWLKACKKAIEKRFAGRVRQAAGQPSPPPKVTLTLNLDPLCGPGFVKPWLYARCPWCEQTKLPNCLMCARMFHQVEKVVASKTFLALRSAVFPGSYVDPPDEVALAALLDWCEEFLGERPALDLPKENS
jgi:hypothetical protein